MRTLDDWPLRSRLVQAFYGLVWYPAKTLWPTRLAALYELPHDLNPLEPRYLACCAIVLLGGAAVLFFHRRIPAVASAAAIYAVTVAPVLGLTQAGDQFVADRYAYLSTISLFVLGAGGVALLLTRLPAERRWVPFMGALAIVAASAGATWMQTRAWHDSITLWGEAIRKDPGRVMARVNYGINLEQAGRLDEAIEHYRIATRLGPGEGRGWYALAKALSKQGDLTGAEEAYRNSARSLPQAYMPLVNLGNLLLRKGRADEALECYRAAVHDVEHPRPGSLVSPVPYLALGAELERRGDVRGARGAFESALAVAEGELRRRPDKNPGINRSARDEAIRRLAQLPSGT
jgi:tetratricopeptide (TPR) repeat protein